LIPKARAALQRYGHQVVVGNDLHRRKFEVVFVEPTNLERGANPESGKEGETGFKETWLKLDDASERSTGQGELEIESLIVERLVQRHTAWIEAGQKK
jgi:phosphopantothenate-cysteine ligase